MDNYRDDAIGTYIGRVFRVLRNTLQKRFDEAGYHITLEQWLILLLLKMKDGRTQHELTHTCDKEKTTITRLLDGMHKRGMIKRTQDENDRRSNIIHITQEGLNVESLLTPIAIEVNKEALKGFKEDEINLFVSFLDRIIKNLNNEN